MNLQRKYGLGMAPSPRLSLGGGGGGVPTTETLTFDGATFTFDGVLSYGTYEDGSYWISGGGGMVTARDSTPATTTADRTLAAGGTTGVTTVHGAMVNPGNAGGLATLAQRQAANFGHSGGSPAQGYDSYVVSTNLAYSGALNRAGAPITLTEGTILKAISTLSGVASSGRPSLQKLVPFTVVNAPPPAGSFRPAHALASKAALWQASMIDMSRLPNLSSAGLTVPSYAATLAKLRFVSWQHTYNVNSRNIMVAADGAPVYGGDRHAYMEAMLGLCFDTWSSGEKLAITKRLVQMAIDIAGRAVEGAIYTPNGGHCAGAKLLVCFAAHILGDDPILSGILRYTAQGSNYNSPATPVGASIWGEDAQIGTITQALINQTRAIPYTQDQLGWPEWSGDGFTGEGFTSACNHLGAGVNYLDDATNNKGYRAIIPQVTVPGALALRLMGAGTLFGNQTFFDYQDRFMAWRTANGPFPPGSNDILQFTRDAWAAHRGTTGLWTPNSTTVVGLQGQSQVEYLTNNTSFYRQLPQPANAGAALNMVTYVDTTAVPGGAGSPTRWDVTPANVAAGRINPVLAAWSVWLAYVLPGKQFVIADLCVPGTSRATLMQNAHTEARWPQYLSMLSAVRADFDDFTHIIECWQGDDAATAKTFAAEWAPFYLGQRAGGGAFTLGTVNPDSTRNSARQVDNCLWDVEAANASFGRGVFRKSRTKLMFTGWPTFSARPDAPAAEQRNSSTNSDGSPAASYASQLDMPARKLLTDFLADPRVTVFSGGEVGSAHIAEMLSGGNHPSTVTPDGQILMGWGYAAAIAKAAGMAISDPTIIGTQTASDGSYTDVIVALPNGGNLTTTRILESRAAIASEPPHYQAVMGFELQRVGETEAQRRAIGKVGEASYPADHQGTVTIQNAGTGTGASRTGVIRITWAVPVTTGCILDFGRGDASLSFLNPRDVDAKLFLNMPIETVPAWRDVTATYPFPGIAVKPQPDRLILTLGGGAWNTVGGQNQIVVNAMPTVAAPIATAGSNQIIVTG